MWNISLIFWLCDHSFILRKIWSTNWKKLTVTWNKYDLRIFINTYFMVEYNYFTWLLIDLQHYIWFIGCRSVSNGPGQYKYDYYGSHTGIAVLLTFAFYELMKTEETREKKKVTTEKTQVTDWTTENQQKDVMFKTLEITIPEVWHTFLPASTFKMTKITISCLYTFLTIDWI